eukprot:CAMPEP_0183706606 /NCGR_PEP_ID=MMETSP0737-20130205/3372_1 /TAXON_ID=385413 /ORGANISM="Thalassiosira miniscula, Strain CCMP1093" /LENGTH=329 /DNA_ID=CAMNT_0025934053 /DNA_START=61 /DNA_END=1050 /DNA_ORIENTATION=+
MTDNSNSLKWIGDGSEGGTLNTTAEGSTITFASATQGTPFNIRPDNADNAAAEPYYEVKVTDFPKGSSLGVGLVTANGFQPGWKTKGYFYNGNITNGSAGLIIGFGKFIKEGDTVGVYHQVVDTSRGQCNIIFYHNGICLGAGFSGVHDSNEKLYPCLHLTGSSTVTFSTPQSPATFEREQPVYDHGNPYSGDWAIEQAFAGPELGGLHLSGENKFKVSFERVDSASPPDDGVQYHLSVKIDNSFRTSLKITGKMEAFDKIELDGRCMATRRMPSPENEELENFIGSALSNPGGFQKMIITEQEKLIMSGPTAEIICSRFIETFEPEKM